MPVRMKFILWNILGFAIGVFAVVSGAVWDNLFSPPVGIAWIVTMIIAVSTGAIVEPRAAERTIGVTISFQKWFVWLICAVILGAGVALGVSLESQVWH